MHDHNVEYQTLTQSQLYHRHRNRRLPRRGTVMTKDQYIYDLLENDCWHMFVGR
jgi:hypothetical protein